MGTGLINALSHRLPAKEISITVHLSDLYLQATSEQRSTTPAPCMRMVMNWRDVLAMSLVAAAV
jgi:hypothetical protein